MPWKQTNEMEERIRFVVRAEQEGISLTGLCQEFGIHRATGWRWLRRRKEIGPIEELREYSRKPHHSPRQTETRIEERILALRQKYGWGALKRQVLLAEEGEKISVSMINRLLKRGGVIPAEESHRPAFRRFERREPNQLWRMDFKGVKERLVARHGTMYPLSVLDDHSRFLVGLFALPEPSGAATLECLRQIFEPYGLPEAMLMDHGSPWWSTSNGHGLTRLTVALMKQDIRLYFSGIRIGF